MSAEMHDSEIIHEVSTSASQEVRMEIADRSLWLVDTKAPIDKETGDLLRLAEETYIHFKQTFHWPDEVCGELFDRIMGSSGDASDELHEKMLDLYLKSLGSSFVQDESRKVYNFIFQKFTRLKQDITAIKISLETEYEDGQNKYDDLFVPRHLLLTIKRLDMHEG